MKKLLLLAFGLMLSLQISAQQNVGQTLEGSAQALSLKGLGEEAVKDFLNKNMDDPELYNDTWQSLVNYAISKDSAKWAFLRDLHIVFKTFQSTSGASALGFEYDFSFNHATYKDNDKSRTSNSVNFNATGNVSFDKDVNPNDFLKTSLDYTFTKFWGGVVKKADSATFNKLNKLDDQLVTLSDPNGTQAQQLWQQYYELLKYSTQYYVGFTPQLSLESNQTFTNKQFVYAGNLSLGMKSWDKTSLVSKLNIFDYPFALIRWVTGTNSKFQPYGSTFPTVVAGVNYVNPINDAQRQAITGNTDGYERFNIESSFRTLVATIESENIYFNANIRYYKEIGASDAIKAAGLNEFFYFVAALKSSTGFHASYARGTLPFDVQGDEVYSVGFHYKF